MGVIVCEMVNATNGNLPFRNTFEYDPLSQNSNSPMQNARCQPERSLLNTGDGSACYSDIPDFAKEPQAATGGLLFPRSFFSVSNHFPESKALRGMLDVSPDELPAMRA